MNAIRKTATLYLRGFTEELMRIEKEYIKSGYFWLPAQQENKIPGTLTIKNGGDIKLDVIGLFNKSIKALNEGNDLIRIIGSIEEDGLITLDDCFYTNRNFSSGGISKSKICVNRIFSGVAYDNNEEPTFNTISFSVDCLDEWIGLSGINVKNNWDNQTATISYKPLEKIIYSLDNGMQLEICFTYTLPGSPTTTEAKITQRSYFKLSSKDLMPLQGFTEIIYKITHFMCFAIDDTVTLKNLTATSSEIQKEYCKGKFYPVPIRIYYPSIPYSEKIPKKNGHQMLFNYGSIKTNAQKIFNNWLNAYETFSPALDLYFSTKIGAQKFLEGKFLALAQGLETYHRRTSDEKLMDENKFKALVNDIKRNCPEDSINWLEGRLMYGNEINLRKRLKKIIEPFNKYTGTRRERDRLIANIVDTRNYLTHYSEDLRAKSVQGKELWLLCQKMEVIFQLLFLKGIGFNNDGINNVVQNNHLFKNKINQLQ